MKSKKVGDKRWDFQVTPSEDDRKAGFITKERFAELLKDDLHSGGYELIEVDWDFMGGNYFEIMNPEGNRECIYGPKIPDMIPLKVKEKTCTSK